MSRRDKFEMKYDILGLANAIVLDESGRKIQIFRLWKYRSAIFVFLRHFNCIACRAHAVEVWKNRQAYQKLGACIYFIGNGSPEAIAKFKEELQLDHAIIFTDPTLQSFRAAGLKRGILSTLGPSALVNAIGLATQGYEQKMPDATSGDNWQLGGVLVVKPDGRITYQYVSEALGDFPPEEDTVAISQAGCTIQAAA